MKAVRINMIFILPAVYNPVLLRTESKTGRNFALDFFSSAI